MKKRRKCSLGAISPLFHNILLPFGRSGTRFSLRDKRLFEINEFEITRVNCIHLVYPYFPKYLDIFTPNHTYHKGLTNRLNYVVVINLHMEWETMPKHLYINSLIWLQSCLSKCLHKYGNCVLTLW